MTHDHTAHVHHHEHHPAPEQPGGKQRELGQAAEPHPHEHTHRAHDEHDGHEMHGGHDHGAMVADFRRRFFVSLLLTVPIVVLTPMIQHWLGIQVAFPGDVWILLGLSTVVYFYGGRPFLTGFVDEVRSRRPGMMTLVALAITVAYVYSIGVVFGLTGMLFFWETATLIDLMLLGHWVEMRSVMGASRALEELARLVPAEAHRITDGDATEDVPVEQLQRGDRIRIRPGEKIPADGRVLEGRTSIDESMLTGESVPVSKQAGDTVIAGAINGTGALVVEVEKAGADSYLNQVIRLVREAQQSKSRTQHLADRAAFFLTLVAIAAGVLTFVAWYLLLETELAFSLERAVTVMVIACPHALGLAIPLVVAVSTSQSAGRGLLIRNRTAFEQARNVDTVVFDKTGTLTQGTFGVTDVLTFGEATEDDVLRLAAAVEVNSEHPIAAGVVRSAQERGLRLPSAEAFEALTGQGVRARVDGADVRVLSPGAVREQGPALPENGTDRLGRAGKTVVYVVQNGAVIGALALADVIRPESGEAVRQLHALGIDVIMLTGDKKEVADAVAAEIGVDAVIAEVLPDQKSSKIKALQSEGRVVAMTGDGVNDAPALATADVGLAIGAGTDVAIETGDVILTRSDPRDAVSVLKLSRATYRKMVQNLWYAAGYNVIALPLAAGVLAWAGIVLSPAVGAVLMSFSTVVVAINARFLHAE